MNKKTVSTNKNRNNTFIVIALLVLLVASFYIIRDFVNVIFITYIYVLVLMPFYKYLIKKFNLPSWAAVLIILLSTLVVLLIPLFLFVSISISGINDFISGFGTEINLNILEKSINDLILKLSEITGISISPISLTSLIQNSFLDISNSLLDKVKDIGISLFNFFALTFIFMLLVFYLFPYMEYVKKLLINVIPLDFEDAEIYLNRSNVVIVDIIRGTALVALAQGVASYIIFLILGVPYAIFFTVLCMVFSAIPLIGTGFIIIPLAIIYILNGDYFTGVTLLLWQFIVVASVDNLTRPFVTSKKVALHPFLVFIGFLGGLNILGFMGVLYGPIILILLKTTLDFYLESYKGVKIEMPEIMSTKHQDRLFSKIKKKFVKKQKK